MKTTWGEFIEDRIRVFKTFPHIAEQYRREGFDVVFEGPYGRCVKREHIPVAKFQEPIGMGLCRPPGAEFIEIHPKGEEKAWP
jgi:hypothetical protein